MHLKNTTLDDIASVIGFSATLRLSAWYGDGTANLFIPRNAEDGQVLSNLLGIDNARRLSTEWGGEHMAIPRLKVYQDGIRKRMVGKMLEKGQSTRDVAECLQISPRRVQQICRELEQAGLIPIQGPRKESEDAPTGVSNEVWARVLQDDSRRHMVLRMTHMNFSQYEIAGHLNIDEVTVANIQKSLISLGGLSMRMWSKTASKVRNADEVAGSGRKQAREVQRAQIHRINPQRKEKSSWGDAGKNGGVDDLKIGWATPPTPHRPAAGGMTGGGGLRHSAAAQASRWAGVSSTPLVAAQAA